MTAAAASWQRKLAAASAESRQQRNMAIISAMASPAALTAMPPYRKAAYKLIKRGLKIFSYGQYINGHGGGVNGYSMSAGSSSAWRFNKRQCIIENKGIIISVSNGWL